VLNDSCVSLLPHIIRATFATLTFALIPTLGYSQAVCGALTAPAGSIVDVTPSQAASLPAIVGSSQPDQTIRLADGIYNVPQTLSFRTAGVTIRSASGNRDAVVLDGRYAIGNVMNVTASNVTVADLTVTRAYNHPIHVMGGTASTTGTLLHNLRAVDGAEQFVKINPVNGFFAESGTIRCSSLELTDAGPGFIRNDCYTGGVDGHQARGWAVIANTFIGFWCESGLSEHAVHFWTVAATPWLNGMSSSILRERSGSGWAKGGLAATMTIGHAEGR
jgi:hypothetical protein